MGENGYMGVLSSMAQDIVNGWRTSFPKWVSSAASLTNFNIATITFQHEILVTVEWCSSEVVQFQFLLGSRWKRRLILSKLVVLLLQQLQRLTWKSDPYSPDLLLTSWEKPLQQTLLFESGGKVENFIHFCFENMKHGSHICVWPFAHSIILRR